MNAPEAEDLLAERLNHEPVVLLGYTDSELAWAIKIAGLLGFPVTLGIGWVFGKAMTGLGGGLLLTLGLVVAGGKILQRLKRGKPDFYYQTRLGLALHRAGLRDCGLIRYRGVMSLGRTRYHRF
jgi:conjugative transfer region protein (TIGR03750 family)